jgi:hypothetical protein
MKITDLFEMSEEAIDDVQREIKKVYLPLGLEINFTKHFVSRIVDNAVDNQGYQRDNISPEELTKVFAALKKHYKEVFDEAHNHDDEIKANKFDGVILDLPRKISIPFALEFSKAKGRYIMTCKTVIKRENFHAKDTDHIITLRIID